MLDRLVGFELSPVLWRKVSRTFAGRVQSVASKISVEEKKIESFKSTSSYRISAIFESKNQENVLRFHIDLKEKLLKSF